MGKFKSLVPSPGMIVRVGISLIVIATVLPFIPVVGPKIRAAMSSGVGGLIGSGSKQT